MRKIIDKLGDLRYLSTAFAAFAVVFGVLTVEDLGIFFSSYFAGVGGAIALLSWLDED